MTKDEALKLALEALEPVAKEYAEQYEGEIPSNVADAITAIKEALADPSPNFNCKSVQARLATAWGYVKAPPEQEPVKFEAVWDSGPTNKDYEDAMRLKRLQQLTAPPQRKPLTDEEIILIVAECAASHQHTDIHFARAIERAHGIKELV